MLPSVGQLVTRQVFTSDLLKFGTIYRAVSETSLNLWHRLSVLYLCTIKILRRQFMILMIQDLSRLCV